MLIHLNELMGGGPALLRLPFGFHKPVITGAAAKDMQVFHQIAVGFF